MREPPESETPGSGATGPGVENETGVDASFGSKGSSSAAAEPAETSNIVPFRRGSPKGDHPYEIVEIFPWTMLAPLQFWIVLAGPATGPYCGGRVPWHHVASVDSKDPAEAIRLAEDLAEQYRIPIVDLAGILAAPDVPGAA